MANDQTTQVKERETESTTGKLYDRPEFKDHYDNFIGGKFVAPVDGEYFDDIAPMDGKPFTKVARSNAKDIELALDAAHKAAKDWNQASAAERSKVLLDIADIIEENLEYLARVETVENGKPIRETLNADLPLAVDHFRYFAGVIRAEEGGISELDKDTVSINLPEPLGVVGQIIPWNFPLLMAAWKMAPALAAGNCTVIKAAEQTPTSIIILADLIKEVVPDGVLNVVNGFGSEAGKPLASSPRIAKVAFTGETTTGRLIMQYASENLIPVTLELGGKSPNVFFESVMNADDDFFDKALEGAAMFALNQGEVCTSPSRILVQESIADAFIDQVVERVKKIKVGNPLNSETMVGAQASNDQFEKILNYLEIGREEGAQVLTGGQKANVGSNGTSGGYYIEPTIFKGHNKMRVFQEEIFGPVASLTTFKDEADAIGISNETLYGLGAGVWTRDAHQLYRIPRAIKAGRVWVNCYHHYPAHAAFGGYKKSGFGRENHKMMLDHYRQTKNMLVSYDKKAQGFF
ncbi:aldehyde dehydrogenase family protein [Nitrosococcus watsonii]|uniref:Aldehyde dehydrogenase (NAD(+)) n=1 Tax=Nitrosococcus watsoni (strain C-113) TaxID=105559 RepID=D8KC59_NITWC|nr:aldehyde dehydrogenase family protein [Nitrosococcus watsonii]ADJ29730.1 Aldehyde dehydrogenase (NAD(+)) [Nitrosococcus watsonii C-113]